MKWHIGNPTEYGTFNACQVYDENENGVCQVYGLSMYTKLEDMGERDADGLQKAFLISAAPELLEILDEITEVISFDPRLYNILGKERYDRAREAVKKAKGES